MHERPDSVDNNFCDSFVNSCAQVDWSKRPKELRTSPLRDEGNKGLIKVVWHIASREDVLNFLSDRMLKSWPEVLKKPRM